MTITESLQWDLVDRLAKSLRVAGVKPGEMADYLEVHRNTVGAYLHGRTNPDHRTLALWAMRCGVPLEWLKHGTVPAPRSGGDQWAPWDSNPQPTVYARRRLLAVA